MAFALSIRPFRGGWVTRASCVLLLGSHLVTGSAAGLVLDRDAHFEIPAQPLEDSLLAFSRQANMPVFINSDAMANQRAPAVYGTISARAALAQILSLTGFTYTTVGNTITVGGESQPGTKVADLETQRAPSKSRATTRLAAAEPSGSLQLEEIVVTAQKRAERLQDVPVPVTAISAQSLVENDQVRLQDYYTRVPGLSLATNEFTGAPFIAIRGITTGGLTNPTVSVVVDDVPFGSSSSLVWGYDVPDLDPSDLSNVEVLRGPQGTLYGASSLGGLIKLATVAPSTERLTGHVDVGLSGIQNGAGAGYNVRAAVNVPLDDRAAIRVSGFTRHDPGYIDNVLTGEKGVNSVTTTGGRLAGLLQLADTVSLKLSALGQRSDRDGSPYVTQGLGDLQQSNVRGSGYLDKRMQAYSATLNAKLGRFDLTSVTGYSINKFDTSVDFSSLFGQLVEGRFGQSGAPVRSLLENKKFTEELRVSTWLGSSVEWLLGAFYDHENSNQHQWAYSETPATGELAGTYLEFVGPSKYEEVAGFTDVTVHFTTAFDVQLGGRVSDIKQRYQQYWDGFYVVDLLQRTPPFDPPMTRSDEHAFTYLVTPRYKFSEDLMVYARLASGYRPGGPNVNSSSFGLPPTYDHDTTKNYEVGIKGSALERRVSFDASIYHIVWDGIQLGLFDPRTGQNYNANGSAAKSQGVELSLDTRPARGLTVAVTGSFNHAVLTQAMPSGAAYGMVGDRLPYSSRFSGSFSVEQTIPLTAKLTGVVGGAVSYVGDREGIFTSTPVRQDLPGYAQADLHLGSVYESWRANIFINNVADKRGLLTGGIGTYLPSAFNYIQPRTIGVNLSKDFF